MPLLALLLGALATLNPFVGIILMLIYCGYLLRKQEVKPLSRIGLFFIFPIMFAVLLKGQPGILLMASDALWAVGLATAAYLLTLNRQGRPTAALTNAAILIIVYGIARQFLFGTYLYQANEQAIAEIGKLAPQLVRHPDFAGSLSLMRKFIPASWTVPQLLALFLGHVFFLNTGGAKLDWKNFGVPIYYNLLILLILPLYFFPPLRAVFINSLVTLCVLPLIQGVGVVLHYVSRLTSNVAITALLMVLVIFNLFLVVLLGFADIWLDFRKIKDIKGTNS